MKYKIDVAIKYPCKRVTLLAEDLAGIRWSEFSEACIKIFETVGYMALYSYVSTYSYSYLLFQPACSILRKFLPKWHR